jgi:adenylosuccinate synthase
MSSWPSCGSSPVYLHASKTHVRVIVCFQYGDNTSVVQWLSLHYGYHSVRVHGHNGHGNVLVQHGVTAQLRQLPSVPARLKNTGVLRCNMGLSEFEPSTTV